MWWKYVIILYAFMSCLLHCTDCRCGCTRTCTDPCVKSPTYCVGMGGMVHPLLTCCGGKTCCAGCDYFCQGYGGECFSSVTHNCAFEITPPASLCGGCPGLTSCCTRGTLTLKEVPDG